MSILRILGFLPTFNPPSDSVFLYDNSSNILESRLPSGKLRTYLYEEDNGGVKSIPHIHPNATTLISGFMSAADKIKLDGVIAPVSLRNKTQLTSNSNTVLVNVPELAFPVVAGKVYKIEFSLPYSATATNRGFAFAFTKSAAAAALISGFATMTTTANAVISYPINAFNTVVASNASWSTTRSHVEGHFLIECTASGIITPQFRTNSAGNAVVLLGGYLTYVEVA